MGLRTPDAIISWLAKERCDKIAVMIKFISISNESGITSSVF